MHTRIPGDFPDSPQVCCGWRSRGAGNGAGFDPLRKEILFQSGVFLEDAGRTELDFMAEVVGMAVREGANVVNIPDTVGYLNPSEYGAIFKYLKENVPDIEKAAERALP